MTNTTKERLILYPSMKEGNQFTIPESLLIVPQHLTDYEIEITTNGYGWETQNHTHTHTISDTFTGGGSASSETHNHTVNHTKRKVKVHGALKVNDKVALIRKQGGQSYFILDRI